MKVPVPGKMGKQGWMIDDLDACYKDYVAKAMAEEIEKEFMAKYSGWQNAVMPCEEVPVAEYIPHISSNNRRFLQEMLSGMGEDEARRLLAHLNDVVVDKTFSVSKTIDDAIVEYHVTRG